MYWLAFDEGLPIRDFETPSDVFLFARGVAAFDAARASEDAAGNIVRLSPGSTVPEPAMFARVLSGIGMPAARRRQRRHVTRIPQGGVA